MSINECLEIFKERKPLSVLSAELFFYLICSNISNQSNTILISPDSFNVCPINTCADYIMHFGPI